MPKDKKTDELLDSNYDGIQEFDNDLPKWWLYLFYGTIIFSIVYIFYYEFGPGPSPTEVLARELKARTETHSTSNQVVTEADLLTYVAKPENISKGKEIFNTKCGVCHGADGGGLIGPNLTDKYWIHGGKISDIYKIIEVGVLDKGMLAWKGVLKEDELKSVSAYVWSLKGTKPANPKAPQGEEVKDLP